MVLGLKHSERAQAALADAIFLLVICSCLAALMFFFITGSTVKTDVGIDVPGSGRLMLVKTNAYGSSVERIALEFYGTDFATSAVQTLLYSSTPRKHGERLADTKEVDYLLAFLKEDYANHRGFSLESKKLVLKDLNTIMASALSNYDFLFSMRTLPFESKDVSSFAMVVLKYNQEVSPGNFAIRYFFCYPEKGSESFIEEEFLSQTGSSIRAQPVALHFRYGDWESGKWIYKEEKLFTELRLWPSLKLDEKLIFHDLDPNDDLNCYLAQ
ncbi:MAG: hypothetical protein QXK06_04010 [Candidatus Diapherotrites archaeon]